MLWTLFANLLDNAIKYTPEKGQIRVKITNQNDQVAVEIKDNGMGIDLKKQGKIFVAGGGENGNNVRFIIFSSFLKEYKWDLY